MNKGLSMRCTRDPSRKAKQNGIAMVAALLFIAVFMAMAAGMLSMSSANTQSAQNHRNANAALNAALSGLECARYQILNAPTFETSSNTVSVEDADRMWQGSNGHGGLYGRLVAANLGEKAEKKNVSGGEEILTGRVKAGRGNGLNNGQGNAWAWGLRRRENASFQLRFIRYDDDPFTIHVFSTGDDDGQITRTIKVQANIAKKAKVLEYALAGRGRMWLAGDTTIHGDVYSSWDRAEISPFNMTDDSTVEGSLNTVLPWQDILQESYQMQTYQYDGGNLVLDDGKRMASGGTLLDANGNTITNSSGSPIDILDLNFKIFDGKNIALDGAGNPIVGYVNGEPIGTVTYGNPVEAFNGDGSRTFSSSDELQGTYDTVNYSQPGQNDIPGLNISDYDRTEIVNTYRNITTDITKSNSATQYTGSIESLGSTNGTRWRYEYFPHNADSYTTGSGLKIKRYIYKNQSFTNKTLPANTNALFVNCTFNGVLFIDCNTNTSANFNNVRFDDCAFNGVIATDVPNALNWQRNALYFTGSSTFDNQSDFQEFTILAPHFNVNLGNANNGEVQSDENVITGAVVGGIVDIRGNAQVYGTVISMCDTSQWSSGYVTNIGATLGDGGSETTTIEDIGKIEITPDRDQMLPSGIKSPVIINLKMNSYEEVRQ